MSQQFIGHDDVGILDSPEEVLTTLTKEGERKWIYPTPSKGYFYKWRLIVGWALIALFLALPLIPINGRPALLFDVLQREFAIFGFVFYPTDTLLLLLLAISVAIGIILFTALLGRVWCGWACPQTVYLEFVYRPIERLFEGKEHVRKRRDEGPWTWDKAWRKGAKLSTYLVISLILSHSFVAYFVGWENLIRWIQSPPTENWGYFVMMAFTTGLVMFDFTYFREQMCTITCPYARFQSVLLDPDSLIVSYDEDRGEPRGRGKKRDGLGDCIDCYACVRTCPTGIDIREGLQMECVACTQCIDACDDIMDKMGFEPGLIRYTSEHELEGKKTRWLRPRTMLYSGLLVVLLSAFTLVLANRGAYDVNVGRSVGEPFMELPDGQIANRLRFRVHNQTAEATSFRISVVAPDGAEARIVGTQPITLEPQEMTRTEAWIVVPPDAFEDGSREGTFRLTFDDGTTHDVSFMLLGPSG
ncbi:MAG: cytochrome c oxidase accessory protein CcoG [Bacteroidetes bacterium]|jgi:cytochrome c oxidase accessory protein FixG|nr:cytochrome c oxidase accessory protein CcoG [Bacteroidota bacterium]